MRIEMRSILLALSLTVAGIGIGVGPAFAAGGPHAQLAKKAETVHVNIQNVTTPDGSQGAYVGSGGVGNAVLFTAHVGQPVVLVVNNESFMAHDFHVATLGLDKSIGTGATVTIKFTPKKAGLIKWDCPVPCGDWVMAHMGYMEGYLKVLAK